VRRRIECLRPILSLTLNPMIGRTLRPEHPRMLLE
jgi:hypothetical protein